MKKSVKVFICLSACFCAFLISFIVKPGEAFNSRTDCLFNSSKFDVERCWNVNSTEFDHAMQELSLKYSYCKGIDDDLLLFLIAKNAVPQFLFHKGAPSIVFNCSMITNPSNERQTEIRNRLLQLVRIGDEISPNVPNHVQSWNNFTSEPGMGVWADHSKSTVIWRLFGGVNLAQRSQLSGLCYFHSTIVLQHYLVSMSGHSSAGMIDMTDFMRKYYSSEQIFGHVFSDDGGNSFVVINQIMLPDTRFFFDGGGDKFVQYFNTYGAAIIPWFAVYKSFFEKKSCHLEPPGKSADFVGYHSMLVVGYRMEGSELRVLVQNWWDSKQFFETNLTYLREHGTPVVFVETKQSYIPNQFVSYDAAFAVNINDRPSRPRMTEGKTY